MRLSEFDPPAKRVFIGPETPGHGFIDDRHTQRFFMVLFSEKTSAPQRNTHRA
jgi:hypothetical protein